MKNQIPHYSQTDHKSAHLAGFADVEIHRCNIALYFNQQAGNGYFGAIGAVHEGNQTFSIRNYRRDLFVAVQFSMKNQVGAIGLLRAQQKGWRCKGQAGYCKQFFSWK